MTQPEPIAGVGRLAEAVVDVLLERRPLDQMRRWLSRDVVGQLTAPNGLGRPNGLSGLSSYAGASGSAGGAAGTNSTGSGPGPNSSPYGVGVSGPNGGQPGAGPSTGERRTPRFASRSLIRSIRLHQPAAGIVESTVVVQDGPRVRAVALRFEQSAPLGPTRQNRPPGFDWLCTALQFN